jgi:hypothetical protein
MVHQHVIGGDAGLAGVDEFAPNDATGGGGDIGARVDDAGTLAAELQGHRGQVRGGGTHDDAPGSEGRAQPLQHRRNGLDIDGGLEVYTGGHGTSCGPFLCESALAVEGGNIGRLNALFPPYQRNQRIIHSYRRLP